MIIAGLEDAQDIASAKAFEAREAEGGADWLPWELAKRLRRGANPVTIWREHRGFSQPALAARAGMTAAQLSKIEAGKKTGSVATLRKLASVVGVAVDDFLAS